MTSPVDASAYTDDETRDVITVGPQTRRVHYLKALAPYFDAVKRGEKTFEVRLNDRDYRPGDELVLVRVEDPRAPVPADAPMLHVLVPYVMTGGKFGLSPAWAILALRLLPRRGEVRLTAHQGDTVVYDQTHEALRMRDPVDRLEFDPDAVSGIADALGELTFDRHRYEWLRDLPIEVPPDAIVPPYLTVVAVPPPEPSDAQPHRFTTSS